MTTTCLVTTRDAADGELRQLRERCPNTVVATAIAVVIGFGVGFGLGALVEFGRTACIVSGVAWSLACLGGMRGSVTQLRQRTRDLATGQIEVLEVRDAVPFLIAPREVSDDPTLFFELPDGRTLVLVGAWLSETQTFGDAPRAAEEGYEESSFDAYANHLQPPWSFPTSAFRLTRFAATGVVTRIEVLGDYVAPQTANVSPVRIRGDRQSYLVAGRSS